MRFFILFTLLFLFSIIDTSLLSIDKVNYKVIQYVSATNVAIYLFQVVILLLLKSLVKNKKLFIFVTAFVAAMNIIALKLAYFEYFLQLKNIYQLAIFLLLIKLFYELFKFAEERKSVFKASVVIVLTMLLVPLSNLYNTIDYPHSAQKMGEGWGGEHRSFANSIVDVELINKPNIHVITFDSLMPEALVRKYFSIEEELPYVKTIEKNNGIIFKNSFAMHVPTQRFWSSFLMLDQTRFNIDHRRFSGQKDSLLFNILRSNGYKVLTGYPGSYFGTKKGEYVNTYDTYASESGVPDSIYCLSSDATAKNTVAYFIEKHYDLCDSSLYDPIRRHFVKDVKKPLFSPGQELHLTYDLQMGFQDKAIENIKMTKLDKNPWVTLHHFQTIGHVGSSFITYDQEELKKYIKNYTSKMQIVSKYVEKILKAAGDNSIVLIMGDHGSYISTSLRNFKQLPKSGKEFVIQDRHGVMTALFGISDTNVCANEFKPYYSYRTQKNNYTYALDYDSPEVNQGYTSSARILSSVIRCLSSSPTGLDQALNFTNPKNFNDFLYE